MYCILVGRVTIRREEKKKKEKRVWKSSERGTGKGKDSSVFSLLPRLEPQFAGAEIVFVRMGRLSLLYCYTGLSLLKE